MSLFIRPEDIPVNSFHRKSILEKIIIPWVQDNCPNCDQAFQLREFLFDLMDIKETWDEPWNDKDKIRLVMCQLPVPLSNGEEAPAWQVYAGKEWTGDDSLEKLYGSRKDRFFLKPPEPEWDEKTKRRWEAFYRWLGVSWRPKVLPYHLPGTPKHDSTWNDDREKSFSLSGPEASKESWEEYCHWLKEKEVKKFWRKDLFERTPHMVDNRFLDGWETISNNNELSESALHLLTIELVEVNKEARIKYSSNILKDNKNDSWSPPSFLYYTIQNYPWLPTVDQEVYGKSQSAFDLFIPDSQLDRAFSEILPRLSIEVKTTKQAEDFLKVIGVRSEFRELREEDWVRWAGLMKERFPKPDEEEVEKITSFYRKLLDEFPTDEKRLDLPPLRDVDVLAFNGAQWGYRKPSNSFSTVADHFKNSVSIESIC